MRLVSVQSSGFQLFELVPDESYTNDIEARHMWGLPGVRCDTCGATWANVGVAYPTADLSALNDAERYTRGWPVPWSEFEERRKAVLPLLPPGAMAPPGTGLGPLVGRARGTFADVVWPNPWTMLVASQPLALLREKDIGQLAGAVAHLKGAEAPQLVELEIEPLGRLAPGSVPTVDPCRVCGRVALTRPSEVIIDEASIPPDRHFFRLSDLTTMIVATAHAVQALHELELRGFRYSEVARR
jgi:uncharacterized double-CXXCG motif protein